MAKEGQLFAAMVLGTFMTALDATVVSVALPSMAEAFGQGGSTGDISWVLLGYTLAVCCFVLLWGKLGTNIGYSKVFVAGVAVFTVTSLLIGISGFTGLGLGFVIVMRIAQGLGAGMVMAMGMAMVSHYFPDSRGTKIGYITLAQSAGTAMGPAIGGLLTHFDWSLIFFVNVPIGIVCVALCLRTMDDIRVKVQEKRRLDIPGAVSLAIMLFPLIMYLNKGSDLGWLSPACLGMLAIGIIGAFAVWWSERRASDPIVSFRLLKDRSILSMNVASLLLFGAMAGSYLLIPYYLEYVLGYADMEFGVVLVGLIMIANSVGMMVAGPFVGKASDRTGKNRVFVVVGSLIAAVGFFLMSLYGRDTSIPFVLVSLFVMGVGVGMALVASTNLAYRHSRPEESGQLSSLTMTFRQGGSSAGVCILQAVLILSIGNYVHGTNVIEYFNRLPGFEAAFLVAVIMAIAAAVIAMLARDSPEKDAVA